MKKIEMLYNTIKKLSQAEKRSFRLEITKYKETSNYVKIYDFFAKSTKFPSQKRIDRFVEAEKVQNLTMNISYIFDKLIGFLINNRTPIYDTETQKQLMERAHRAKMLRTLGFFKAAKKETLNLLKKADKYGYYQFCIDALMDLHIYQSFKVGLTEYDFQSINGQNLSLVERVKFYQTRLQQHQLLQALNIQYVEATTLLRANPTINIEQLKLETIPHINDDIPNKKDRILHGQISICSFLIHEQLDELESYLIKIKQKIDKECLRSPNEVIFYSFILHTYGHFVLFEKLYPSFPKFVEDYKKTIEQKSKYSSTISPQTKMGIDTVGKTLLADSLYLKNNLRSEDIKKLGMESNALYVGSKTTYFKYLFNVSFLYLIVKDYKSFNKCILKINNAEAEEVKIVSWEAPFIELIESFENGTEEYTRYQLSKLKRSGKAKQNIPPIQSLILSLIQKLLNNPQKQQLVIMKENLSILIDLEKRFLLRHFRYSFWLKKRIEELEMKIRFFTIYEVTFYFFVSYSLLNRALYLILQISFLF